MKEAELLWCKKVQSIEFDNMFQNPNEKERNMLKQLDLFKDGDGIIRCFGRMKNADIPEVAKFPKLLPRGHHLTKLVVERCHKKMKHTGVSHTLSEVRNEYWIPRGRTEVRKVLTKCQVCVRHEGGPYKLPEMPPYPKERVTAAAPFSFTGLDYLGPLYIKDGQNSKKVWVCLFTCMVVRAVHLEVVADMTSEQFIMCLKRFISRRGKPSEIISDNAPQFKLAQQAIEKVWKEDNVDEDVVNYVAEEGIQWKYITEYAPWMGGFYERMVQSVKKALRKCLGSSMMTYVQLETLITEIEAMLNTRPLCYVGEDTDGSQVLTPGHFLSINAKTGMKDANEDADPDYKMSSVEILLNNWKGATIFCRTSGYAGKRERYQRHIKSSGKHTNQDPQKDDVVLIKDNGARGAWKIGKIESLVKSFDGAIRSANVRISSGKIVHRPLNMLFPLETSKIQDEEETAAKEAMTDKAEVGMARPKRKAAVDAREKISDIFGAAGVDED